MNDGISDHPIYSIDSHNETVLAKHNVRYRFEPDTLY